MWTDPDASDVYAHAFSAASSVTFALNARTGVIRMRGPEQFVWW